MKPMNNSIYSKVDGKDKEKNTNDLKDLSFELSNPKPSKELLEALNEGESIIQKLKDGKRKGYNNVNEMMNDILK